MNLPVSKNRVFAILINPNFLTFTVKACQLHSHYTSNASQNFTFLLFCFVYWPFNAESARTAETALSAGP